METQKFVYHLVPEQFEGDSLIPFKSLSQNLPELRKKYYEKYEDYPSLAERNIPIINAPWTGVIHFSTLSPALARRGLQKLGQDPSLIPKTAWFKIPVDRLDPNVTVVYTPTRVLGYKENIPQDWVRPFSIKDYQEKTDLPEYAHPYYRDFIAKKKRAILFYPLQHVFFKGVLKVNEDWIQLS